MTLTLKQMDDINVQLTEVSLELLGNKFFDLHGQHCNSLGVLCTVNSTKSQNYDENQTDLMQWLGITTTGKTAVHRRQQNHQQHTAQQQQQHNYDTSGVVDDQQRTSDDQQSSTSRHRNNITNRRNTHVNRRPTLGHQSNEKTDEDILVENRIKQSVTEETKRMTIFSERMKEKHYLQNKGRMESEYMDEFELVNEYHIKEKDELMMESCALIEFIKFIRNRPENASKMEEITKHILSVKDQL